MKRKVNLATYDNSWYKPGSIIKRTLWYLVSALVFTNSFVPVTSLKVFLLKSFGAKIGKRNVIKPGVCIKYPWNLNVGSDCWIGEGVWIDNLDMVTIKDNVCISQGAMLLCGNHNYKRSTFDLMIEPITLEEGSWVGARSLVSPGVVMASHAILTVGSVATGKIEAYGIYKGNPAIKTGIREITE